MLPLSLIHISYNLESFVRKVRFRVTRKLPTLPATEVFPEVKDVEICLRTFSNQFGNVKFEELALLSAVARARKPASIFEFGTFDGLTGWHLLANTPDSTTLTTIDLPLDHAARASSKHDRSVGKIEGIEVGKWLVNSEFCNRFEQLLEDSMDFDCSRFEDSIDYCFVDASHEYQHVRRDSLNALQMVRTGGCIFWHDYSRWWPGVQRVLDDLSDSVKLFRIEGTSLAAAIV